MLTLTPLKRARMPCRVPTEVCISTMKRAPGRQKLAITVQNETKRDELQMVRKPTTLYQRLTTTPSPVIPFWHLEGGAPRRSNPTQIESGLCQRCAIHVPLSRG